MTTERSCSASALAAKEERVCSSRENGNSPDVPLGPFHAPLSPRPGGGGCHDMVFSGSWGSSSMVSYPQWSQPSHMVETKWSRWCLRMPSSCWAGLRDYGTVASSSTPLGQLHKKQVKEGANSSKAPTVPRASRPRRAEKSDPGWCWFCFVSIPERTIFSRQACNL